MPLLFSYGTLKEDTVQLSNFGRLLKGRPDELVGFRQSTVRIEDPDFVSVSGKAEHLIVTFTGAAENRVDGMAFEVTDRELLKADEYEPAGYERIITTLASGDHAWVYVQTL